MNDSIEVKKLSAKVIMEKTSVKKADAGKLFDIMGQAISVKSDESNYGTWTALKGRFHAIRASDGKTFSSSTCFLPDLGMDIILSAMAARNDSDKKAVEFAFEIHKKENDEIAVGYEYDVVPVIKPVIENDPMDSLKQKMVEAQEQKAKGTPNSRLKTAAQMEKEKTAKK